MGTAPFLGRDSEICTGVALGALCRLRGDGDLENIGCGLFLSPVRAELSILVGRAPEAHLVLGVALSLPPPPAAPTLSPRIPPLTLSWVSAAQTPGHAWPPGPGLCGPGLSHCLVPAKSTVDVTEGHS